MFHTSYITTLCIVGTTYFSASSHRFNEDKTSRIDIILLSMFPMEGIKSICWMNRSEFLRWHCVLYLCLTALGEPKSFGKEETGEGKVWRVGFLGRPAGDSFLVEETTCANVWESVVRVKYARLWHAQKNGGSWDKLCMNPKKFRCIYIVIYPHSGTHSLMRAMQSPTVPAKSKCGPPTIVYL